MKTILPFSLALLLLSFTSCKDKLAPESSEQAQELAAMKTSIYTTYLSYYQPAPASIGAPVEDASLENYTTTNHPDLTAAIAAMTTPPTLGTATSNPGGTALTMSFTLPDQFQSPHLIARIGKHHITDNNGKVVEFHPIGAVSLGHYYPQSKLVNNQATPVTDREYTAIINSKNSEQLALPLKGSAEILIGYVGDYDFVHFKPEDAGKTVDFKGGQITLLEITDNIAVYKLEGLSMAEADPVVTNDAGHLLSVSPSQQELLSPEYFNGARATNTAIDAVFRNNPAISAEEFGEQMHNFLLGNIQKNKPISNDLIVNRFLFPIQNLTFYTPRMEKEYSLQASF